MRHLPRTHRVQVGWIHEQYQSGHFHFAHESGERMPPDIFTKMFADKDKWVRARQLINVILPAELKAVIEENKEIYQGIQEKPALPATPNATPGPTASSPGGGDWVLLFRGAHPFVFVLFISRGSGFLGLRGAHFAIIFQHSSTST